MVERGIAVDVGARARATCDSLGRWLEAIHWIWFSLLLLVVGVLRIGPLGIGPEWIGWLRDAASSFPSPSQYLSSSIGPALTMRGLGLPGDAVWWALGSLAWLLAFGGSVVVLSRHGRWGRLAAVALVLSPAFSVTVTMLGHYDLWLICGSAILVLVRWRLLAGLGAIVACLGNPEQAVAAAIAIGLVALGLSDARLRNRAAFFLLLAVAWIAAIQVWVAMAGSGGRASALVGLAGLSLLSFLGVWPLAVYAWLGGLWLPFGIALADVRTWGRRLLVAAGVVGVPALASVFTLDGTRVFVAVGAGALVAFGSHVLRRLRDVGPVSTGLLGAGFIALIVFPVVIVDTAGTIRLPYADLLRLIGVT